MPKITLLINSGLPRTLLALALGLAGCGEKKSATPPPPPAEVSILTVTASALPLYTELPGRLSAVREAQVRARATGLLQGRFFEEGALVKQGDLLFQIEPAPLQNSLNMAAANLAKVEALTRESRVKMERYQQLFKNAVVSQEAFDEAAALLAQNEADLLAAKAALETARINLGYAKVLAPISGRIGKALVTEGTLVSSTEFTPLAFIRQLDPIYLDFTQSSTEMLRLKRSFDQGSLKKIDSGQAGITAHLEDGSLYNHPGKLLFSDVAVDPTTGTYTLRAEFPNPDQVLLPGMFARGRLEQGLQTNAITVPQRTVTRGADGTATVHLVTPDNKVELRPIVADMAVSNNWIVTQGLQVGDRIIVEGSQKARPGSVVKPVPFTGTNAPQPSAGSTH